MLRAPCVGAYHFIEDLTVQLLIVWHSRTEASQQLAFFAAQGAQDVIEKLGLKASCSVHCLPAMAVTTTDLLQAAAYLFCAPENLGSLSGEIKAFFDVHYYAVLEQLNGRPYSALISAGSAGHGAAQQIETICTGWRLQLVHPITIFNFGAQTPAEIAAPKSLTFTMTQQAKEIGGLLAAHLALQIN